MEKAMLEFKLDDSLINRFGTYQGHRFGPRSRKGDLYLDVIVPRMRWCIRWPPRICR